MLKETSCIAPFINLTVDPEHNTSPCPYLGGGAWKFKKEQNFKQIWNSKEYQDLRGRINNAEKNPTAEPNMCKNCLKWTSKTS